MLPVLILNGANLNMLGRREPEIYGTQTLADIEALCVARAQTYGLSIDFRQTNHEGVLIDWLQEALDRVCGIIINAGAWTHTSVAIHDALKLHSVPVIEVHISDPRKRESFRHESYITPVAVAVVAGEGIMGYARALEILSTRLLA